MVRPWKPRMAGDDAGAAGGEAGEFDRGLVGFGAGIAQEDARQAGQIAQALLQLSAAVVVEHLRAGDQRGSLGGDGRGDRRVGVPEVGRALPADAVDVLAAVRIPQARALPAHDGDRAFGVQAGGVLGFEVWMVIGRSLRDMEIRCLGAEGLEDEALSTLALRD